MDARFGGVMRIGRSSNENATFDLNRDFAVENKALDVESGERGDNSGK
ncbi:MAG TPA: hypothetical protein VKB79_09045 [Bryobacteraceae bacterium]|nr:hypothetical protein [Bryobacteraceae bacterium]